MFFFQTILSTVALYEKKSSFMSPFTWENEREIYAVRGGWKFSAKLNIFRSADANLKPQ